MMWKKIELGEVFTLKRGFDITKSEQKEGEYPVVSSSGIQSFHNQFTVKGEGVVIGRKGSLGTCFFLRQDFWAHDTTLFVKDFKGNNRRFVYYLLRTLNLASLDVGSSNPSLNRNHVHKIIVTIPTDLSTQSKIASILSAYDDLIENNMKRIKLLEAKAFLRYKQIVRSERMVSENKLVEIIQTVKRKPKILKSDYKELSEFPIIDQSTDFIGGYTNQKEAIYEDLPMIVFGDHTRILKYINFPFACGADGTQLIKPENSNISVAYLYFELISCNLSNYHYARHFKFLKEQVIKLPSETVMLEYNEEANTIFNLIQVLRLQNNKLREARDILLPRLMSGEIEA